MKRNNKRDMLVVIVAATLIVASGFTLKALAQSPIDKATDTVMTEDGQYSQNQPVETLTSTPVVQQIPVIDLTPNQAEPFINAATQYFNEKMDTAVPEQGYETVFQYYEDEDALSITWLPQGWQDDLQPMESDEVLVYFIKFENVDIDAGTGDIAYGDVFNALDNESLN